MAEWKHHIPITKLFPVDEVAPRPDHIKACKAVHDTLIEHRAFLRYEGIDEEEIDKYSEIAGEFWYARPRPYAEWAVEPHEFDDVMDTLYDWADRNRIWID